MPGIFWWVRQIVLILVAGFFLYYGIEMLIFAFGLKAPHVFLMTFFASNLIILISAALIVGFAYRMLRVYRQMRKQDKE
ncbi:MAG: hypothetical protein P8X90_16185 [Desulfobacterales bacterium]|jgi:uncharacterized membrane protein YidH (DUF202 family)